jgi:hypothetical protein
MSFWIRFMDRMGALFGPDRERPSRLDEDIEIPSEIADLAEAARRRLEAAGHRGPAEELAERLEPGSIGPSLALGLDGSEDKRREDDALRRDEEKDR